MVLIGQPAVVSKGAEGPIVIAHRGASGYLPEHTLAAKALAFGMRADYLEQDVVLTRDDQPIVLHDIHLDLVTNVADVFAGRQRADGRFYAIDFTVEEIKRLTVHERVDRVTGRPVYPGRFPLDHAPFQVPTLAEEIEFVQGIMRSSGRPVGIYPEIKAPAWHRDAGKDISRIVVELLGRYGYATRADQVFLQCFDAGELRRIRRDLRCDLKLVQLIGENSWQEGSTDFDRLRTPEGLARVAQYADGIGPRVEHLFDSDGAVGTLPEMARRAGLVVHAFTFRRDDLPPFADAPARLLEKLFQEAQVDGLFTDFPDVVVDFLEQ